MKEIYRWSGRVAGSDPARERDAWHRCALLLTEAAAAMPSPHGRDYVGDHERQQARAVHDTVCREINSALDYVQAQLEMWSDRADGR
jgi:hypothetical protein